MQLHDASPRAGDARRSDDAEMFDLAPVSLWLEDYSGIRIQLEEWRRAGVTDLRAFLEADDARVRACSSRIEILKVNRRTLAMYEATDIRHLVENIGRILSKDMLKTHIEELVQLWEGKSEFNSHTVNYTLSGARLDIQLKGAILPGHEEKWDRVLVAIEDVTGRETATRKLAQSDAYARGLFEHSPISLWVEDFSGVKTLLDEVRERGISDLRVFTDVHPEFIERCMAEIRVLDINRHTVELFGAESKPALLKRLRDIFRDRMIQPFREQLVDLWDGKLFQRREVVNYSLAGDELHLHMQFSVLPGHERDWSLVQVALTDITARKRAEAYLEFLGKHDVLTKLYNRSFYVDELNRLERKGPFPVSVAVIDLNGLKAANDQLGHGAGDALLRRAGEVLNEVVERPCHAARIGGDEFALLMPGVGEEEMSVLVETIDKLVAINNQFYSATELSLSIGTATAEPGERLEAVVKRADLAMYQAKRAFYARAGTERRLKVPGTPISP
ncbi:diguanylate cyclase (GGDEF) domain-containing protein [Faunimonas pinastri]|uniref:Diguanylate cyclase (GGDEF) domain-containing protein n=1 Tax=Faunimonas pinastri TaxID=1855383 RepID=A0A1H9JFD1_9HYPH|nr:sensor domain-containing diguanylate cyclase [Faunimonas pinastri]SEQ85552.1 diguanylate cyclase (GGDEF) domain-containing protein [Faunimonas pinastri]